MDACSPSGLSSCAGANQRDDVISGFPHKTLADNRGEWGKSVVMSVGVSSREERSCDETGMLFVLAVCAKEKAAGKSEDAWTAKLVLLCAGVR